MVLHLLKPALQRGMFGDYTGNILQHFRADLCVHDNLQVVVPHTWARGLSKG